MSYRRQTTKRRQLAALAMAISLCVLSGCKESPARSSAGASPQEEEREVEPPVVSRENSQLLYSFLDVSGRIQATSDIDEVPEKVRKRVLVVDLSKSPAERQAHRYAFFADLTDANEDGHFEVTVVSRYDAAKSKEGGEGLLPNIPDGTVILYSAVWCGYCKKAKAWLKKNAVPFVVRDVEKTPGAAGELKAKLQARSMQGGGVPVIDWNGELVVGFDQNTLRGLLAANTPAGNNPTTKPDSESE